VSVLNLEEAEAQCRDGWTARDSPEQAYDRRWALTVLNRAFHRLEAEARAGGKARQFERLHVFLSREAEVDEYARLARDLGVSAGAIGVAVHRLRQRYREWVRTEVSGTLSDPALAEEEMRDMLAALQSEPA
jgi:DNA-directed RNA polymerase specialized sigma24 family protein